MTMAEAKQVLLTIKRPAPGWVAAVPEVTVAGMVLRRRIACGGLN